MIDQEKERQDQKLEEVQDDQEARVAALERMNRRLEEIRCRNECKEKGFNIEGGENNGS